MATATKKSEVESIVIEPMELKNLEILLIGDSPFIVHAWDEKSKKMILDKQQKKASKGREAKDPFMDFVNTLYWLSEKPKKPTMEDVQNGTFGFPATGFKKAAVDAGYQQGKSIAKTTSRGAFHINGEFVEIIGTPTMREDMVRIAKGGTDIRYRAEFKEWKALLHIRYNARVLSAEQIVDLFNTAGFSNGVGEWRPSRDGSYGMFHVATEGELKL